MGAKVEVRNAKDFVIDAPVGPGDWWIALGPSNTSEHRRAVFRAGNDTVLHIAQRFAIDWVKMDARGEYARDHNGRTNAAWYGYGEPVRAVGNAQVAEIADSIPDNDPPGRGSRAVRITTGTLLGNYVMLDLGPGAPGSYRYALYGHLKPGSIKVKVGDTVSRGTILGAIGNSGNSDAPHLHFQVTETPDASAAALRAEGVPYVLRGFTVVRHDPQQVSQGAKLSAMGTHTNALPVEGDVIRIK